MDKERQRTAIHEAGHGVAFMRHGIPVSRLWLRDSEGLGGCEPAAKFEAIPPRAKIESGYAGAAAERVLLGVSSAEISFEDLRWMEAGLQELGQLPSRLATSWLARQADAQAFEWREQIKLLADRVLDRGALSNAGIAELCRQPKSSLAVWANLYPVVVPETGSKGECEYVGNMVRLPDGRELRWSPEHGCYLSMKKKGPGVLMSVPTSSFL